MTFENSKDKENCTKEKTTAPWKWMLKSHNSCEWANFELGSKLRRCDPWG